MPLSRVVKFFTGDATERQPARLQANAIEAGGPARLQANAVEAGGPARLQLNCRGAGGDP